MRKPNILVIMSDEHNTLLTGCYGSKIVRTPHMDALARRGVTFDNCYCNSPLCVPSRLSFTAGKYISRIGGWNNECMLPPDAPSLPRVMTAAGYESFLCGKMHYDQSCRYGFTEVGGNYNTSFMDGSGERRKADDLTSHGKVSNRLVNLEPGVGPRMPQDMRVREGTVDFLRGRKGTDKPFFFLSGFLAPHFPLIAPAEYFEHFKGKVPLPRWPDKHIESLPLNYQHLRINFALDRVPDELTVRAREMYCALLEWVDGQIGQVLAALADSDVADNTIVIYTSDHGENFGEHGLWWKNTMFEHAARVPLIVSWPSRWEGGSERTGACSLLDLVQTITDLGAAGLPEDWNGTSLLPWLDDPRAKWKDLAVSEYYAHNIASGYAMIRTGDYKYVYHTPPDGKHPAQRELYDLRADPDEFENRAGDAKNKGLIAQLHAALVKEIGEEPDKSEARCRADYARGYGRVRPTATPRGPQPAPAWGP